MNFNHCSKLQFAARALRAGQVAVHPTEAVWGLACDPFNRGAVSHLLRLKRRAPSKGLILVGSHPRQFEFLLHDLPKAQQRTMLRTWPGPNTWLVAHNLRVPQWISGAHPTVAIRVSAHPTVAALCDLFGGALVSTSANPQGCQPARFSFQARRYFGPQVVYAAGQVNLGGRPSTIRDLISGQVIRA